MKKAKKIEYDRLFLQVQNFASNFFAKHEKKVLVYHNFQHTKYVVNKTIEIAAHYKISDEDLFILCTAAWFHDVGYLVADPKNHEAKSVEVFKKFAAQLNLTEKLITDISNCILATKVPRDPKNLNEEIICDADTFNLGTKEFVETNKLIFKEVQDLRNGKVSKLDFDQGTLRFLKQHKFYTSYCNLLLLNGKRLNIKILTSQLQKESKTKIISKKAN